ncbi:MAG: transporter [Deltaproteobacteria bacterium]|nr:transporter [Deltaproteobacteria bacterium]
MMKSKTKHTRLWAFLATLAITLSFSGQALAVDDGARAYWKGRDGTNVVAFQYLNLNMQASDSQQFDPGQFIYPNSDAEANVMIANYARHFTLFNRASSLAVNLAGGSVDVDVNTSLVPPQFLPPGIAPGITFSQSASGFADPSVQLDVNLFGTSQLKSTVDLVNYEPKWTLDAAVLLAFPIGQYDEDKLVNMGLNRWYGRFALPIKYHFGAFAPGYRSSFELTPSVWLFAENDDFLGQKLKNDPMWQIEAHLTHDFTRSFFGSLDLLYRGGFQSEINGVEMGQDLDIGNLGFTLNYQVNDNLAIRAGYSSNVFGENDLDNSIIRIEFVYGWHRLMENMKKLKSGH